MAVNCVIHSLIFVPVVLLALVISCIILPPYYIYKFIFYLYSCFKSENIKGKVVLITGASSGIGEQLAYEYAKRKAYLVIVARRESQLKKVAEQARLLGSPDVFPICADVSNENDCKQFVEEAVKRFGQLDHLINNAGIASIGSIAETTDIKKFRPLMDVNFWGSIYPTFFAIPHLKKTRGKIVVNSSATAFLHPPKLGFYCASKAALASFYESMRVELAPEISITVATLGFVDSEMTQGKLLSHEGTFQVDKRVTDISALFPVMKSSDCAKAIVDEVCRGGRYVTEPKYWG